MSEWINKSYRHIGDLFNATSVNDFYNLLNSKKNDIIHVHSMYSISDSTQTTDEICETVANMGGSSVTLTDHGTLLGINSLIKSGEKYNINVVPGAEFYFGDKRNHLLLFARNHKGFLDISYALR